MTIGNIIRKERKKRGFSQSDLAKLLKISRNTLSMYELDKQAPSYAVLKRLIDLFRLDANVFFDNM